MTDAKTTQPRHPAKYSDALLPVMLDMLSGCDLVLDPFAGTGKIKRIVPNAVLVEIEPEWARIGGAVCGNALCLPFASGTFDAICTSPTYGNRMADHHNARDDSQRNTYTHAIGRKLHGQNSGAMQWGDEYRDFHVQSWKEAYRVLKPDGIFVLNIADHIRKGKQQLVTDWHISALWYCGFTKIEHRTIRAPGQRMGANGSVRVGYESVIKFAKVGV